MLDDYSNGCARARSLDTTAKIKIMGEPSLVFTGLWFGTHVLFMRLPSEKYKTRLHYERRTILKTSKI
jgi:hypothetical protein